MTLGNLAVAIANIGEFQTLSAAIEAGFNAAGYGQIITTSGGAASVDSSSTASAMEMAEVVGSELVASQTVTESAAICLAETAGGTYKAVGLLSMDLGAVAAACAPLAGAAIGVGAYESNPKFWTDLSTKLLPFCYPGTYRIPTWLDIVRDTQLGEYLYTLLVGTDVVNTIIDTLKELAPGLKPTVPSDFESGTYQTGAMSTHSVMEYWTWADGAKDRAFSVVPDLIGMAIAWVDITPTSGSGWCLAMGYGSITVTNEGTAIISGHCLAAWVTPDGITDISWGEGSMALGSYTNWHASMGDNPWTGTIPDGVSPWAGEPAPDIIPEWPDIPVPSPSPVTPIIPIEPIEPSRIIPFPEPEIQPDPNDPPEEWPNEEPYPKVIPFPPEWVPDNPDDPDTPPPNVIPFPLPPEPPEEWPNEPDGWPEEYPPSIPWPSTPEEWPDSVPWPDMPPEFWPDETPWPDSPEEWPEEIPWPVPWPEDWPDGEPWPVKWPYPTPYPTPYPYPYPSPDPEENPDPSPEPFPESDPNIDPKIEPWIQPLPDPNVNPFPESPHIPSPDIPPETIQDPYTPFAPPNIPVNPDSPYQPQPEPDPSPDYPLPNEPTPPPSGSSPWPVILPDTPLAFSGSAGLISVYHPSQANLLAFANWLWVTYADVTIDKLWNNPFDGVISLFELYCTPTDNGNKNIRCGFLDSGINSPIISRYTEIDCGTLAIPEYYGNYFDYSPYSKAHIYLPFIGIQELNVDDIVGHSVNVTYKIDEYNGSCIAMITCAKQTVVNGVTHSYNNTVYQFSGNCAVELPLSGGSQASIVSGMTVGNAYQQAGQIAANSSLVGGLASLISANPIGGVVGGVGGYFTQQAYAQAQGLQNMLGGKSTVQKSGSFGSSHGALGIKTPFITVIRPKQIRVSNYNKLYGYPAHKMVTLGTCEGFIRCREVQVNSSTATDAEKNIIESMLKTGVYMTEGL